MGSADIGPAAPLRPPRNDSLRTVAYGVDCGCGLRDGHLVLLLNASQLAPGQVCLLPLGEAVPDASTARRIAEAIITSRMPSSRTRRYQLVVEPDEEVAGAWLAHQSMPRPQQTRRSITVAMGGGGLTMRIDRCTGTISNLYYQR